MYFSGNDVEIIIDHNLVLDVPLFQFQVSRSKLPIYGYKSTRFDAIANGEELVQGQFVLNFKYSAELYYYKTGKILDQPHASPQDLVDLHFDRIDMFYTDTKEALGLANNSISNDGLANPRLGVLPDRLNYTLTDVHIQTMGQSISTGGEPIGESYSFLARGVSHARSPLLDKPATPSLSEEEEDLGLPYNLDPGARQLLLDPLFHKFIDEVDDEDMPVVELIDTPFGNFDDWIPLVPKAPIETIHYTIESIGLLWAHAVYDTNSRLETDLTKYTWREYRGYKDPNLETSLLYEPTAGRIVFAPAGIVPETSRPSTLRNPYLPKQEKTLVYDLLPNKWEIHVNSPALVPYIPLSLGRLATTGGSRHGRDATHYAFHPNFMHFQDQNGTDGFIELSRSIRHGAVKNITTSSIGSRMKFSPMIHTIDVYSIDYSVFELRTILDINLLERLHWTELKDDGINLKPGRYGLPDTTIFDNNSFYSNGKEFMAAPQKTSGILTNTALINFLKAGTTTWTTPTWEPPDSSPPYNDNSG